MVEVRRVREGKRERREREREKLTFITTPLIITNPLP
jgi:hypothetical protein